MRVSIRAIGKEFSDVAPYVEEAVSAFGDPF
jgi:hypothetical protein